MKRSGFSEEQIIGTLKEHQAGLVAKELCRKYGVSDATFFKWRPKYGGMEVSDAKKLKEHRQEICNSLGPERNQEFFGLRNVAETVQTLRSATPSLARNQLVEVSE